MMRSLTYPLSVAAVLALGFWAYREGYETRAVEREVRQLEREIAAKRRDLRMLRAEWAYLNRPDRLSALVELNFADLQLMPVTDGHFGTAAEVPDLPPPVAVAELGLDASVSGIVPTNFEFGAGAAPVVIAPAAPAADGEQVP
ncbi:cell division protein FtsL [Jannaschia sp. Os4]|uniref:cell division protein FtsL n=1 Tax=Jannaschia sp. Os4 TaxID=2807617 RepID=UPI00193A9812|nr:cell division protein FtsL [Jannaschia sp. Os4]MBM2576964.1 cell division protein FtsL [Jannaschia sp. Os4]